MATESLRQAEHGGAHGRLSTIRIGPVGVEVRGLELVPASAGEVLSDLKDLILREGLVLLREQSLTPDEHVAIGERFGSLEQLDVNAGEGDPALAVLTNLDERGNVRAENDPMMKLVSINERWHTDSSFRPIPAAFSLFRCVIAPPMGGDTFFASLSRAWQTLPEEERSALYALEGVHDYAAAYRSGGSDSGEAVVFDDPPVVHPIVRRHPETGETSLYLSEHVSRIVGMSDADGRALLDRLVAHVTAPERVYRHSWRVGDVLIWDNRFMLHRAQGFDAQHARVMHHVRVAGTEPVIAAEP